MYSKEDMLSSLRQAADELGHSPTVREYKELDISPSAVHIRQQLGGWQKAKRMAGLEETELGRSVDSVPEPVNKTQEEWENLSYKRRSSLRKSLHYAKKKVERGCSRCGYDTHSVALDWHHTGDEKNSNISTMIRDSRPYTVIDEEIEKCEVLCATCHREVGEHIFDSEQLSRWDGNIRMEK